MRLFLAVKIQILFLEAKFQKNKCDETAASLVISTSSRKVQGQMWRQDLLDETDKFPDRMLQVENLPVTNE